MKKKNKINELEKRIAFYEQYSKYKHPERDMSVYDGIIENIINELKQDLREAKLLKINKLWQK